MTSLFFFKILKNNSNYKKTNYNYKKSTMPFLFRNKKYRFIETFFWHCIHRVKLQHRSPKMHFYWRNRNGVGNLNTSYHFDGLDWRIFSRAQRSRELSHKVSSDPSIGENAIKFLH